jgi:hypothetical protein
MKLAELQALRCASALVYHTMGLDPNAVSFDIPRVKSDLHHRPTRQALLISRLIPLLSRPLFPLEFAWLCQYSAEVQSLYLYQQEVHIYIVQSYTAVVRGKRIFASIGIHNQKSPCQVTLINNCLLDPNHAIHNFTKMIGVIGDVKILSGRLYFQMEESVQYPRLQNSLVWYFSLTFNVAQ